MRAGLLIYKPIKSPQTTTSSVESNIRQIIGLNQTPTPSSQNYGFLQNMFSGLKTYSQNNGLHGTQSTDGHQTAQSDGYTPYQNPSYLQNNGLSSHSAYQFPMTGSGSSSSSIEQIQNQEYRHPTNYNFQQPISTHDFNQQFAARYPGSHVYSQDIHNSFGSDQHNSASNSEDHIVPSTFKHTYLGEKTKQKNKSTGLTSDFFIPSTTGHSIEVSSRYSKKRSAPKSDEELSSTDTIAQDSIVPLKYHDDSSPENQAKLKHTVQQFFSLLQKNHCKYTLNT